MNVYPLKCRIRAAAGIARVDVYDDIGGDPFFGGGISAGDFAGQLADVRGPLDVHINSGGGDVFDGMAIAEAIRNHRGPVTTVVDGIAASIASVIAQAGHQRVMAPGSMMMIHDAFGATVGNAAEVTKFAETLDKISNNLSAVYAARSGGTPAAWRQAMKAETWYTADEAVEAGLADAVGGDAAALPAQLDVAAMAPARIAAALRTLPRAAAPMEDNGPDAPMCKTCAGSGRLKNPGTGKAGKVCPGCDGSGVYDPDKDGDDDSSAAGDTDHDYVLPDESPGPKAKPGNWLTEQVRAVVREELRGGQEGACCDQCGPGCQCMAAEDPAAAFTRLIRNADKYNTDDRKQMASSGEAMEDGSYPIKDGEDLDNAIHAVGRGGADHDAIRKHIIKRAAALGQSSKIPDNWNSDGSLSSSTADNLSEAQILALFAGEPIQLGAGKE